MVKIAFISNFYKEEEKKELERVKKEIRVMGFVDEKIYVTDSTKDNRGYVYGLNQAIKKALKDGAETFITFNPDISFSSITKDKLLEGLKHFDILGYANRQNGKIYYGGGLDKWRMSGGLINKKPVNRFVDRDFVSGSLLVFKKKIIDEIGLFDESYFLFYDEVDFCYRARQKGFKVGIDSQLIYDHFEFSQSNLRKEYLLAKSRLKFFLKYSNCLQKIRELIRLPKTISEYFPIIKKYIFNSRFLINFFSMNASSVLIKLLYFVLFIFLIRYLKPAEYGIYNVAWAHIALFSPLLDFGTTSYSIVYLPREKTDKFANLFSLRLFLSIIVFVLTVILAFVWSYEPMTKKYIFLTSFVIFSNMFSGSYLILNSLKEKVYFSSLVSFIFNCILVLSFVTSLLLKKSLSTIFILIFIFYNLYSLVNFILIQKSLNKKWAIIFDPKNWWQVIKKAYVFVLISFFGGLYSKIDVFILNFLKGAASVGIYSAGYKFLDALMFMVGSYNISSTPNLVKRAKEGKHSLKQKIKKDLLLVVAISVPITVFTVLFGPYILPLILKSSYSPSITVARIVICALPIIMISSVFINSLYALDKAKLVIFVFLFQVVFNLVSNYLLVPHYSFFASAWITLAGEVLNVIIFYLLLKKNL